MVPVRRGRDRAGDQRGDGSRWSSRRRCSTRRSDCRAAVSPSTLRPTGRSRTSRPAVRRAVGGIVARKLWRAQPRIATATRHAPLAAGSATGSVSSSATPARFSGGPQDQARALDWRLIWPSPEDGDDFGGTLDLPVRALGASTGAAAAGSETATPDEPTAIAPASCASAESALNWATRKVHVRHQDDDP